MYVAPNKVSGRVVNTVILIRCNPRNSEIDLRSFAPPNPVPLHFLE